MVRVLGILLLLSSVLIAVADEKANEAVGGSEINNAPVVEDTETLKQISQLEEEQRDSPFDDFSDNVLTVEPNEYSYDGDYLDDALLDDELSLDSLDDAIYQNDYSNYDDPAYIDTVEPYGSSRSYDSDTIRYPNPNKTSRSKSYDYETASNPSYHGSSVYPGYTGPLCPCNDTHSAHGGSNAGFHHHTHDSKIPCGLHYSEPKAVVISSPYNSKRKKKDKRFKHKDESFLEPIDLKLPDFTSLYDRHSIGQKEKSIHQKSSDAKDKKSKKKHHDDKGHSKHDKYSSGFGEDKYNENKNGRHNTDYDRKESLGHKNDFFKSNKNAFTHSLQGLDDYKPNYKEISLDHSIPPISGLDNYNPNYEEPFAKHSIPPISRLDDYRPKYDQPPRKHSIAPILGLDKYNSNYEEPFSKHSIPPISGLDEYNANYKKHSSKKSKSHNSGLDNYNQIHGDTSPKYSDHLEGPDNYNSLKRQDNYHLNYEDYPPEHSTAPISGARDYSPIHEDSISKYSSRLEGLDTYNQLEGLDNFKSIKGLDNYKDIKGLDNYNPVYEEPSLKYSVPFPEIEPYQPIGKKSSKYSPPYEGLDNYKPHYENPEIEERPPISSLGLDSYEHPHRNPKLDPYIPNYEDPSPIPIDTDKRRKPYDDSFSPEYGELLPSEIPEPYEEYPKGYKDSNEPQEREDPFRYHPKEEYGPEGPVNFGLDYHEGYGPYESSGSTYPEENVHPEEPQRPFHYKSLKSKGGNIKNIKRRKLINRLKKLIKMRSYLLKKTSLKKTLKIKIRKAIRKLEESSYYKRLSWKKKALLKKQVRRLVTTRFYENLLGRKRKTLSSDVTEQALLGYKPLPWYVPPLCPLDTAELSRCSTIRKKLVEQIHYYRQLAERGIEPPPSPCLSHVNNPGSRSKCSGYEASNLPVLQSNAGIQELISLKNAVLDLKSQLGRKDSSAHKGSAQFDTENTQEKTFLNLPSNLSLKSYSVNDTKLDKDTMAKVEKSLSRPLESLESAKKADKKVVTVENTVPLVDKLPNRDLYMMIKVNESDSNAMSSVLKNSGYLPQIFDSEDAAKKNNEVSSVSKSIVVSSLNVLKNAGGPKKLTFGLPDTAQAAKKDTLDSGISKSSSSTSPGENKDTAPWDSWKF